MATFRLPILGPMTIPSGTAGSVYMAPISTQLTISSGGGTPYCFVIEAGAGDTGVAGVFSIPNNYFGSPKIIARCILDGDPTGTTFAAGVTMLARADGEAWDTADEAEDTMTNSTWTAHADKDVYEIEITPTVTLAVDDDVRFDWHRDVTSDTYTGFLLMIGLYFEYADA